MPVAAACLVISSVTVRMTAGMAATSRTALLPPAAPVKSPVGTTPAFPEAGCATTTWTARTNRTSRRSAAVATQRRQPSARPVRCSAARGNAFTESGAATGIRTARMAATRKTAVSSLLGLFCFGNVWLGFIACSCSCHGNMTFCFLHVLAFWLTNRSVFVRVICSGPYLQARPV